MSIKIYGIDTNHHHPITDWNKVKEFLYNKNSKQNFGFVMVRLGYSATGGHGGLILDRIALDSLHKCNSLGIPCGVYVYSYDRSPEAATITMKAAIDAIKNFDIDYPVVYDIEYEPFNKTCGREYNNKIVKAAMQVIEKAGYYSMIYASRDFFKNYLIQSQLSAFDKWEAAYTVADDRTVTNGIWQFTSKGSVPGITGNVDMNVAYKDYKAIIENAGLNGKSSGKNKLYSVTVKPVSAGDKEYIVNEAKSLGVSYEVTEVG